DGIEGVSVYNMADQSVGCLHDYQLQTRDMATLEDASALVISGGGMERFMDKVFSLRADLPVIEASAGIDMLPAGHEHEHGAQAGDDGHEDEERNAHVWLDPKLAARQVENIAEGLAAADPAHAQAYRANALAYAERLLALDEELAAQLAPLEGAPIVIFHEGFAYMAEAYGLTVAGVVEHEESEEPGTREIAQLCDLVREEGVRALFVEKGTTVRAAETVARETGAVLSELDPVTGGDGEPDGYERAMRENAAALLAALNTEASGQ
ncbi:MAG: metal ABC transporter substrate-binding protein, partial [Clostridia bacterium]|nr:metal ABC transporter substrate-binding protein [Clostridia bacterium]